MLMMATAKKLWDLLEPGERRGALLLSVLMFAVGVVEVTGIISVVPLVAVLTSASDPCARPGEHAGAGCSRLLPTPDPYVLAPLAFRPIPMRNLLAFPRVWLSR